jgi:hypothetical protein
MPVTQGAIMFPEKGRNSTQFMSLLDLLSSFVLHRNDELRRRHGMEHDSFPESELTGVT